MYAGSGYFLAQVSASDTPYPSDSTSAHRVRLRAVYLAEVGVREASGNNDGPRVAAYLRYCGLGEGYAWCAAFVCWTYGQAGVANPRTAWAAALFPESHLLYQRGQPGRSGTPQQGDVFGIYFANLKRIGHVGFIDDWRAGSYVVTVEGNTNGAVSREGDGVYRKRRPKSQVYKVADFIDRKMAGDEEK